MAIFGFICSQGGKDKDIMHFKIPDLQKINVSCPWYVLSVLVEGKGDRVYAVVPRMN